MIRKKIEKIFFVNIYLLIFIRHDISSIIDHTDLQLMNYKYIIIKRLLCNNSLCFTPYTLRLACST